MTSITALHAIDTHLRGKLVARLAMRWPEAVAYTPHGSTKVLCAKPLPEADQTLLDMYILAYQDAITDVLGLVGNEGTQPEVPYALRRAENSVFQGGSFPPSSKRYRDQPRTEAEKGREARKKLEDIFSGGADG